MEQQSDLYYAVQHEITKEVTVHRHEGKKKVPHLKFVCGEALDRPLLRSIQISKRGPTSLMAHPRA